MDKQSKVLLNSDLFKESILEVSIEETPKNLQNKHFILEQPASVKSNKFLNSQKYSVIDKVMY